MEKGEKGGQRRTKFSIQEGKKRERKNVAHKLHPMLKWYLKIMKTIRRLKHFNQTHEMEAQSIMIQKG